MRFSLPATSCAVALALLAGCSPSQNGATIPVSGISAQTTQTVGAAPDGNAVALQRLELQAAGTLPGPAAPQAMAYTLRYYASHPHQQMRVAGKGTVSIWATNLYTNYLIGLTATNKLAMAIDTGTNGGFSPNGVKVDHNQNVWVANEYDSTFKGGVLQEYDKTGTFKTSYKFYPNSCGSGSVTTCLDFGFDSAENSKYVFAAETEFYYVDGNGASDYGSGIFRFANGNPSGMPKYYPISDFNSQLNCTPSACDEISYIDVDRAGNIWFDFSMNGQPPGGLGELAANGTVTIVKTGAYGFVGGVYVSNQGKVLNVTDQTSRKTYRYHLPVTAASKAFRVIGPTPTNLEGIGNPISGGFDSTDANIVIGDAVGWIDHCVVSTNKCKAVPNINFPGTGANGAAYTLSDK